MRRRVLVWLSVLSLLLTGVTLTGTVATAPAAAAHPYCGQVWGSLEKGVPDMSAGRLTDVRAGHNA